MNIHGYCPHCNANLDGELVTVSLEKMLGYSPEKALEQAKGFEGWEEHKENNRWGRQIGLSSIESDRVTEFRCPDCEQTWSRF